mgnify:CR=1 FL=1
MLITEKDLEIARGLIADLDRELEGRTSGTEREEITFGVGLLGDYADLCAKRQPGDGSRWEATDEELIERFGGAVAYARNVLDWLHRGGIGLLTGAGLPIR